ncbi:MAG: hypothetical protein ACYTG5_08235 [Planctomycetota bacterium]|jgi:hypothetical protein
MRESDSSTIAMELDSSGRPRAFWLISILIALFVALCTGNRDNRLAADAWEHHRAIVALVEDLDSPGNPTLATEDPSIRYSPYSVALALICRWTGLDAYDALSAAAVFNTLFLAIAIWLLLGVLGLKAIGPALWIIMLSLWGSAPGYANSYALSDLPWHQVNPSAFSFATGLLCCWLLLRTQAPRPTFWSLALIAILSAIGMLSHPMTGAFSMLIIGLAFVALRRPSLASLTGFGAIVYGGTLLLCIAWPLYDFASALTTTRDSDYWFNRAIWRTILLEWCLPATLLSLLMLPRRSQPALRWAFLCLLVMNALALIAYPLTSASLCRLPIPGVFFAHLLVACYVVERELFSLRSWPGRMRALFSSEVSQQRGAFVDSLVLVACLYGLLPQVWDSLSQPHLARPLIASAIGKDSKELRIREELGELLVDVKRHDVVLADLVTSWAVPSISGRIVGATHFEFFVDGQSERVRDLASFFSDRLDVDRRRIIDEYRVRWILLKKAALDPSVYRSLRVEAAIVKEMDGYVLMDARKWQDSR